MFQREEKGVGNSYIVRHTVRKWMRLDVKNFLKVDLEEDFLKSSLDTALQKIFKMPDNFPRQILVDYWVVRTIMIIAGILLFVVVWPSSSFSQTTCVVQKDRITQILLEATERLQIRMEEVDRQTHLTDLTRGDFRQHAEWLIAWMKDQVAQMDRTACSQLSSLVSTIRIQLVPVQIRSQAVRAATLTWRLDSFTQNNPGISPDAFIEARALLVSVHNTHELAVSRKLLRRAAFLTKIGLRIVEKSATLE
jgi:hypothetical protein